MAIEVDMALSLVFNTQAAVRHLLDGRCQQTMAWKPVTHDLVTGLVLSVKKKPSDSSPRNNRSRAGLVGCWLTNSKF
jgi:hypothetical protein